MYLYKNVQPRRVVLYSHDTQGLGHIRRNLAIASALSQADPKLAILLISGTSIAASLSMPPRTDCLTLPALGKDEIGSYCARTLGIPLKKLIELRTQLILGALASFAPDVFIVDKVPQGALGELQPALKMLKERGTTRCILGLRDVLDDPATTRREWKRTNSDAIIRRCYDAIWVYGDPLVFDPVTEYGFSKDIASKVHHTGYLNRYQVIGEHRNNHRKSEQEFTFTEPRLALCQVGGGQDGYATANAFAHANLPQDVHGVILTGPFMPDDARKQLQQVVAARSSFSLIEYTSDPGALLQRADYVVAMGGYNTTCEILSAHKRALLVPRVKPRLEQWIRAQRLRDLGLLDVVHPDRLTPNHITNWLARESDVSTGKQQTIDLDGLARLPKLLNGVLNRRVQHADVPSNLGVAMQNIKGAQLAPYPQ